MNSSEVAKMGDSLAAEADLLGMIKEVTNVQILRVCTDHQCVILDFKSF